MNVSKMDKVRDRQGNEYAFAKVKRNDWGEYVVQVYVNGTYSEDSTYYTDDKDLGFLYQNILAKNGDVIIGG